MEFKELTLQGLILVVPQVFEDERGVFFERFRLQSITKLVL